MKKNVVLTTDQKRHLIQSGEVSITISRRCELLGLSKSSYYYRKVPVADDTDLSQGHCDIFNPDQGSQFTSESWIKTLVSAGISISMDGRGRYLDNIFVERLWRSVKQECVYLHDFTSVAEVKQALKKYFEYYNHERLDQALDYRIPAAIYFGD